MGGRRIYGSLLGALLTVVAWQVIGVTDFGPRLLLAMLGFGIGHGVVRLVGGAPPPTTPTRTSAPAKSGKAFYAAVGIVVTITITVFVLHRLEVRRAEQALRDARAREESLRAGVAGSYSATAATATTPTATSTTTPTFDDFAAKLATIAADPAAHAEGAPLVLDGGTRSAMVAVAGCDAASIAWDPKNKEAWGFSARCAGLEPKDLAPAGGIDAIDATYLVVTTGPLAGVFVDRNLLDPSIWTIATVARRMTYDASMFVFCAEGKVPGRTFLSPSNFQDRCETLMAKKLGRETTYCKFDPPEGQSGFDCSRTWKTRASCGKEIFDENKVSASFTCTYDAKTATVALKP